jgi:hypothetical protein
MHIPLLTAMLRIRAKSCPRRAGAPAAMPRRARGDRTGLSLDTRAEPRSSHSSRAKVLSLEPRPPDGICSVPVELQYCQCRHRAIRLCATQGCQPHLADAVFPEI